MSAKVVSLSIIKYTRNTTDFGSKFDMTVTENLSTSSIKFSKGDIYPRVSLGEQSTVCSLPVNKVNEKIN